MIGLKVVQVAHVKGGHNQGVPGRLPRAVLRVKVVGFRRHVPLHQQQQDQAGEAEHQGGHCENQGQEHLLQPHCSDVRRPRGKPPRGIFGQQRLHDGRVGGGEEGGDGHAGGEGGVVGVAGAEQGGRRVERGEEVARPALVGCVGLVVLEEVGGAKGGWEGGRATHWNHLGESRGERSYRGGKIPQ